jgi:hypothetical protein
MFSQPLVMVTAMFRRWLHLSLSRLEKLACSKLFVGQDTSMAWGAFHRFSCSSMRLS